MDEKLPGKTPPGITLFGLRWEVTSPPIRFGVSDGMRGVGNRRTPIGAYFALREWRKVEPNPSPTTTEGRAS